MFENLKIKPLSKAQITISLDRLTRFKNTEEKYLRVFSDIISSNLIAPKLKKDYVKTMPYREIVKIINKIFDQTLKSLNLKPSKDFTINKILEETEKQTFKIDREAGHLLKNKIDYRAFLQVLPDSLPCNLNWLVHIEDENVQKKYSTLYPIKKVVLVEGITEEILLPKFGQIFGYDFDKNGVFVLPAGGKNQSVKVFYELSKNLRLPIFVLFDKDAADNCKEIKPKLRTGDYVHILECGEFEDTLSLNHIKRTLNLIFKNYYTFSLSQLREDMPMTKILGLIFKQCGSEFKKAEFAHYLSETLKPADLTDEVKNVLVKISGCR